MFQDAREFDVVEIALFVDGGLSVQLIHLFIREPVSHRGQQLPQVVLLDEPWSTGRRTEEEFLHFPANTCMIISYFEFFPSMKDTSSKWKQHY